MPRFELRIAEKEQQRLENDWYKVGPTSGKWISNPYKWPEKPL